MIPASSSRRSRSQQGVADKLTRSARAALEMRPSPCNMLRILMSRASSLSVSDLALTPSRPHRSGAGRLNARVGGVQLSDTDFSHDHGPAPLSAGGVELPGHLPAPLS